MIGYLLRWIITLTIAFGAGKLMAKIKMPAILGWLIFAFLDVPIYLAFVFGGIALATVPAPALSIVNEFHAKGAVTDTLLPMTVLDDVVGIAVFFTVNSLVARKVSGGAVPLYMIPVMIFLPVIIGAVVGFPTGLLLKKCEKKAPTLAVLLSGITVTMLIGLYTFVYILARAFGKYFGAMTGAKLMHMPDTVQKYLGLTLLPHSGVSLVFTGIICSTLASAPQHVQIVQGTIAAAAVINEFLAVIAAKKGFELAGEIQRPQKSQKPLDI